VVLVLAGCFCHILDSKRGVAVAKFGRGAVGRGHKSTIERASAHFAV
jgi:hypothetical protein